MHLLTFIAASYVDAFPREGGWSGLTHDQIRGYMCLC